MTPSFPSLAPCFLLDSLKELQVFTSIFPICAALSLCELEVSLSLVNGDGRHEDNDEEEEDLILSGRVSVSGWSFSCIDGETGANVGREEFCRGTPFMAPVALSRMSLSSSVQGHSRVRIGNVGVWNPELNSRWRRFPVKNVVLISRHPFLGMECGPKPLSPVRVSTPSGEGSAPAPMPALSDAEQAGWEQRQKEAAEVKAPSDPFQWRWTLNWNAITSNITVGSCPRSPEDIDRMVDEAGIDAVLNLQSGLCFDALKIPYDAIRKRAVERGILLERVEIRDFDHADQSLMLPVAVRLLNSLLARGMKVYVHCTAGINRATLTTVGHLTFVQEMDLEEAVAMVKSARPVAHPYIDCWMEVRRRLLDGRQEELTRISEEIHEAQAGKKIPETELTDRVVAEKRLISQTFQRYLDTDLAMLDMETAWLKRKFERELTIDGKGSATH